MQTETKLNVYELLVLTPEEASEFLLEELENRYPDLQFIEDILAYSPVDVNVQDDEGRTALMFAARWGNEKPVELLLKHPGIKVNMQDEGGWTALMLAAFWEHKKCVELLLNHPKIDVNVRNNDGRTAWAYMNKRTKFAKLLKEKMNS